MDIPLLNASNKQDEQSLAEAVERRSEIRSLRLVDSIYAKRVSMETASHPLSYMDLQATL